MIPDQIYQRLKNFSVFKKWSDPDLRELARRVESRQLEPGEVVFQHREISRTPLSQVGSLSDAAYIVNSGQVRQVAHTRTGVELWHRTLGEGQVFGQVRQKSPSVVGSGIRWAAKASWNTSSLRRYSRCSTRFPPQSRL